MPLTSAHAAAAWPLSRLAPVMPASAIVIGSLSPDFEYLLRFAPRGQYGHTLPGLILFCLPLSLAVWLLFEGLVRPALLALLPEGLRNVFRADLRVRGGEGVALAAVAGLLGAVSHVVWDGFTHHDGFAVAWLPLLAAPLGAQGGALAGLAAPGLRWCDLLQHGSTLVGSVALVAWARARIAAVAPAARRFAPGQAARSARIVLILLAISLVAGLLNGLRGRPGGAFAVLAYAAVGAMATLALALLGYAIAGRRFERARRPDYTAGAGTQ